MGRRHPAGKCPGGDSHGRADESDLALVRKPAKIDGVESWSIETIGPRGMVRVLPQPRWAASWRRLVLMAAIRVWDT